MKAIETTATINENGQLMLDESLGLIKPQQVHIIVLLSEDDVSDPDETPTEIVIEGIREGLHQALTGQTIPLSEMWEGINADYSKSDRSDVSDEIIAQAIAQYEQQIKIDP